MRAWLQPSRWPVVAFLCGAATLAACERVTAPDPASTPAAAALSLAKGSIGGSDMVPISIRATFGAAADAKPILCAPTQAGFSIPADKFTGTGNITHAGKSSITDIFDACALVLPPGSGAAWTAQGRTTVTAANGDLIYLTFTMRQFVTGDFVLDSYAITGGTGRFANATGSVTGSGWIDRATLQGYFECTGLITRPNL